MSRATSLLLLLLLLKKNHLLCAVLATLAGEPLHHCHCRLYIEQPVATPQIRARHFWQ